MPTRRIKACPVKVTGTAPDGQQFESTIEEDFFVLLRFNRLVASFEAQPVKVEWLDAKGEIHTYTPDVLVHYRQDMDESASMSPLLCEIKPDHPDDPSRTVTHKRPRKEDDAENALKWAAAKRYATAQGWEFSVFREKDIRTPYLKNVRFLLRALEKMKDSHFQPELLGKLDEYGSLTLDEWAGTLASTLETRAKVLPVCYRLIALQRVGVDLEQPLTLQSMVRAMSHA